MSFIHILLQAGNTAAPQGGGGFMGGSGSTLLLFGLMAVVMWFFMIQPQRKKQKEQNNFLSDIGKGTKVVTIGGIVGKVLEVRNKSFVIEVESGGRLQILKSAVSLENSKAFNLVDADAGKEDKKDKDEEKHRSIDHIA